MVGQDGAGAFLSVCCCQFFTIYFGMRAFAHRTVCAAHLVHPASENHEPRVKKLKVLVHVVYPNSVSAGRRLYVPQGRVTKVESPQYVQDRPPVEHDLASIVKHHAVKQKRLRVSQLARHHRKGGDGS